MASITLSLPAKTVKSMRQFPKTNWQKFIVLRLTEKVRQLDWREKMLQRLDEDAAFEEWAIPMGRKVNKGIAKQLL